MRRPMLIGLPFVALISAGWMLPGTTNLGILSCTVGRAIDTEAASPTTASEAREMICSFKPNNNGPGEAYSAVVKSISTMRALPERLTILWIVKAPFGMQAKPGFLQQGYAVDRAASTGETTPLMGEKNTELSLHPLADKEPGSASRETPPLPRYIITSVELVLQAATG